MKRKITKLTRRTIMMILILAIVLSASAGIAYAKYVTGENIADDISLTVDLKYTLNVKNMTNLLQTFSSSNPTSAVFTTGSAVPESAELKGTVQENGSGPVGVYYDSTSQTVYIAPTNKNDSTRVIYAPQASQCMFAASWTGVSTFESVDFSNLDFTNATSMSAMFDSCSKLKSVNWGNINTENVTSISQMFNDCKSLETMDLSAFDTSKVIYMSRLFEGCSALKSVDVNFDTSSATAMNTMFESCSSLTELDLSSFDTSSIKYAGSMFLGCTSLSKIYASESVSFVNASNTDNMFLGCKSLSGGSGTTYSTSYLDKTYARIDTASTPGYFTGASSAVNAINFEETSDDVQAASDDAAANTADDVDLGAADIDISAEDIEQSKEVTHAQ